MLSNDTEIAGSLGTSSILGAAIIQALGVASGYRYSEKSICHAVLMVEQLLTTGGGWQDQVGSLYPGIKKGFLAKLDSGVEVEKIEIAEDFENEVNRRMVLVYTGKTRLAKNLLQEVVRGWYSGGPIRSVISSLESNVYQFVASLRKGEMPCDLIELYYRAKQMLATGCEPEIVTSLIAQLKRATGLQCVCGKYGLVPLPLIRVYPHSRYPIADPVYTGDIVQERLCYRYGHAVSLYGGFQGFDHTKQLSVQVGDAVVRFRGFDNRRAIEA
ncbi:hypothetical protein TELCIR_03030 [Teladorsagia circumcincta]|uniref:GHMP kinase protein n=1 Tax=Teladorsagia circumcincta TaxID=45464 RepID=A0A2G9UXI0_TELCI|nr:hypothetical protein TELCIR_03030 [Teladorsagia circumcincta]